MNNILQNIMIGFGNFPFFAVLFTLPIFAVQLVKYKTFNPVRILLNYTAILYFLCLFALVFFPIPDMAEAAQLSGYEIQLIPFHFIADIVRESPLVITDLHTYLPAVFNRAVLQVVFNVMMTIPFGMLLRYYFGCSGKKVVVCSFLLSLFIEIGQLTGMFFMYSGSYRLCDVDDLMANTLGGLIGYVIVEVCHFLPEIRTFDFHAAKTKVALVR
ncbi:MAG: VanZ family protein [Agathobacter sp.]|nr:VanZ family protein [Agathobacter sp.]MDY4892600.1 VanZ family protein [Agathobacter sp.]